MLHFKRSSLETYKSLYSCCRTFHCSSSKLLSNNNQEKTHFQDAGPMASRLKSRSVIRFRGPDTIKFLQGLLTNDVRKFGEVIGEKTSTLLTPNVSTVSVPPIYAALLTPQGRFLYDLFLYRPSRGYEKFDSSGSGPGSQSDDEPFDLLADVDAAMLDEILDCFNKYRLRSKVDIENMAEEFSCWQRFGGDLSSKSASGEEPDAAGLGWGGGSDRSGISASRGNSSGWQWYKDPRHHSLGFRGIFPSNTTPPLVEADKETSELNYLQWRVEKGIAEGSSEIPKGEAIPLEYNLTGLNAISFDKGCYVGQEFVARTHHRGVIRKRLIPLRFVDASGKEVVQEVAPGSEVLDTSSDKKVGTVTTALGCRGLGLLRLDAAFKKPSSLNIQGQNDVKIEVIRPDWWPSEWFSDQQENNTAAA